MAEEVKKIITVEVGKSITNVRDFKKHIEDLRGALLGLNEESEEYKTIAEQISTDQAKLNEVLAVGKKNTDSAAGSYNELNNQLKSLRQQYKALSETERNSTTGQAILQSITQLDTQLKDIDSSMGQYYRNVGNYKEAFEEAFKAVSRNIGNINPELGKLMSTASSLIPLIKKATTAATTGLKGIKAGLASTGIGLLVVALGEIVAHWEQIAGWVSRVIGLQNQYTQAVNNTNSAVSQLVVNTQTVLNNMLAIANAQGKTQREQAEMSLRFLNQQKSLYEQIGRIQGDIDSYLNAHKRADTYAARIQAVSDLKLELSSLISVLELTDKPTEAFENYLNFLNENTVAGNVDKITKETKKFLNENKAAFDEAAKQLEGIPQQITQAEVNLQVAKENEKRAAKEAKEESDRAFMTEEERLRKDAQAKIDQINKLKEERTITEQEAADTILAINKKLDKDIQDARNAAYKNSPASQLYEKEKSDAEALYKSLENYGVDELKVLEDQYNRNYVLLETFYGKDNGILIKLTQEYEDKRAEIIAAREKEITDRENAENQERVANLLKSLDDALSDVSFDEQQKVAGAGRMWTRDSWTHESDEKSEYQKQDVIHDIEMQGYQKRLELYDQYLATMDQSSEEYFNLKRERDTEEMAMLQEEYDYANELEDRALAKKKKNMQIAQGMINAYGQMYSAMADYMIQGEEEGSERWKAFKISEAVISTLAGMAGAFMQGMNSAPMPWGAIIGAAGATTAMITGMAQINEIKNTQMGSGNSSISGVSSAGAGVGVEPLLNEQYDLQRLTNLSLQSDDYLPGNTQVYVLESDIQEVGTRVQVRENNATF